MLLFHSQKISQKPENYKEMSLEHISLAFCTDETKTPRLFRVGKFRHKLSCVLSSKIGKLSIQYIPSFIQEYSLFMKITRQYNHFVEFTLRTTISNKSFFNQCSFAG